MNSMEKEARYGKVIPLLRDPEIRPKKSWLRTNSYRSILTGE